ncbi:MAG: hypothetical protein ACLTBV_14015 [Enterocloster bolteae]
MFRSSFVRVLAFLAVTTLDLGLYRKRPSEAAGKAMAFKKSMPPIRILLVLGIGLAGGMFFWSLQTQAALGTVRNHGIGGADPLHRGDYLSF